MKTKQLLLGSIFALTTTLSFAQPSEVTDAAMAYQAAEGAFYSQKMERFVEKVVEGKKAIDIAKEKEDGKTHPKTYQYLAQLNTELIMALGVAQQMGIENADLNAYKGKEEEISEETKMAFKKCKELDTKKKRHIKDLKSYMSGKLGLVEMSATAAFNAKDFGGAMMAFGSGHQLAKMIEDSRADGFKQNALVSFSNYSDSIKKSGKYEEALETYAAAGQLFPKNDVVFGDHLDALVKLKKHDEAKKLMRESAKANPKNFYILYNIGVTYDANYADDPEGVTILKQAVKDNPENEYLNYIAGSMIYNKGAVVYKEFRGMEDTDPKKAESRDAAKAIFTDAAPYLEKTMAIADAGIEATKNDPDMAPEKKAKEIKRLKNRRIKVAKNLYKCYQVLEKKELATKMRAIMTGKE